jgi:hypothetical protein
VNQVMKSIDLEPFQKQTIHDNWIEAKDVGTDETKAEGKNPQRPLEYAKYEPNQSSPDLELSPKDLLDRVLGSAISPNRFSRRPNK